MSVIRVPVIKPNHNEFLPYIWIVCLKLRLWKGKATSHDDKPAKVPIAVFYNFPWVFWLTSACRGTAAGLPLLHLIEWENVNCTTSNTSFCWNTLWATLFQKISHSNVFSKFRVKLLLTFTFREGGGDVVLLTMPPQFYFSIIALMLIGNCFLCPCPPLNSDSFHSWCDGFSHLKK